MQRRVWFSISLKVNISPLCLPLASLNRPHQIRVTDVYKVLDGKGYNLFECSHKDLCHLLATIIIKALLASSAYTTLITIETFYVLLHNSRMTHRVLPKHKLKETFSTFKKFLQAGRKQTF